MRYQYLLRRHLQLHRSCGILTITLLLALCDSIAAAAPLQSKQPDFLLTQDGAPVAALVVPSGCIYHAPERRAAKLVQEFVHRMSQVELPLIEESQITNSPLAADRFSVTGQAVTISNIIAFGNCNIGTQLGISSNALGPGGLRLVTRDNLLLVLGGPAQQPGQQGRDTSGLQHAAIELLERLGCRYLWPGSLGLVIPEQPTLALPRLDYSYTPPIRGRGIRYRDPLQMGGRPNAGLQKLGITLEQWQAAVTNFTAGAPAIPWNRWQRLGGSMPYFGHAGAGLRDGDEQLTNHPAWFALQGDGTRDQMGDSRWRLCKSNPDLIAHVAQDIIKRADADPGLTLVSLDPNDGSSNTGWCICTNCRALDPPTAPTVKMTTFHEPATPGSTQRRREIIQTPALTDRMVYYWNSIAEQVVEHHPHLLFGVSAYSVFCSPPVARRLHPNLVMRYVPFTTNDFQGWRDAGAQNTYWRPNILVVGRFDGKLRCNLTALCENFHYFAAANVLQTDFDSITHCWSTWGFDYYATARLTWNPHLTAAEIIDDYATAGFGSAAPEISAYFRRIDELTSGRPSEADEDELHPEALISYGIKRFFNSADDYCYTPEVTAGLRQLLHTAAARSDDPQIRKRIAFLRLGLNFTELQERLDYLAWLAREGNKPDMEEARRLVELNTLLIRDMLLRHPLAVNMQTIVWYSGNFGRFKPLHGNRISPRNPELAERLGNPGVGVTGEEESLEALLRAYGIE